MKSSYRRFKANPLDRFCMIVECILPKKLVSLEDKLCKNFKPAVASAFEVAIGTIWLLANVVVLPILVACFL